MKRTSAKFLVRPLLLFLVIGLPAFSQEPRIGGWLKPPLDATLITTTGERLPQTRMRFETPPELGEATPAANLFQFEAEPIAPRLEAIRTIQLREETTQWISSQPTAVETFYLGETGHASPPPPDWRRSFGQASVWQPGVDCQPGVQAPFLNRAHYLWAPPRANEQFAKGDFLFRQRFDLANRAQIVRATLRVACTGEMVEIALNDSPVHFGGRAIFGIAEFEVSSLIREGENIIGVRARSLRDAPMHRDAIAYHIELQRVATAPGERADGARQIVLIGRGGDRVWGEIEGFSPQQVLIKTEFGNYSMPWSVTKALVFPQGWRKVEAQSQSLTDRIKGLFGGGGGSERRLEAYGAPLRFWPREKTPEQEIVLADGATSKNDPSHVQGDKLVLQGAAENYAVDLETVVAVYPPGEPWPLLQKPRAKVGPIFCKMLTLRGDTLFGILRQAYGKRTILETQSGDFLRIPPDQIIRITFPYHGLAAFSSDALNSPAAARVAILAQAGGLNGKGADYDELSAELQEAVFLAGLESAMLPQEDLIDAARLTPDRYSVIASVDPLGEYPDTLAADGDARAALERYVDQGGVLLLFSRGGALRTAVVSSQGRFMRTLREGDGLADRFGLETVHPGTKSARAHGPFDHPPNQAAGLVFERAIAPPAGLEALPSRLEPAPMLSAPFYPMIDTAAQAHVVYEIIDEAGRRYGPALSVVRRGNGRIVVIDHLLWRAQFDGEDFTRAALPVILAWAAK